MRIPAKFAVALSLSALILISSCSSEKAKEQESDSKPVEKKFTTASSCGFCHTDIFAQWNGSMHSSAWKDPFYRKMLAKVDEASGGKAGRFCAGCHTPVGVTAGEVPPLDGSKMGKVAPEGVTCDFCHTVSEVTGVGNFQVLSSPGDLKRGPLKDPWIPSHAFHKSSYSEIHTKSEFCGACHNVSHPVNKLAIESTYSEWEKSDYAKEGVTCQDCHMTPGPGVTKPNPGQAAIDGPKREHIFTHWFVGGNASLPASLGSAKHAELAKEQLKAAARIEITGSTGFEAGETGELKVKVFNTGAGHYLPTGGTEFREMWLDIAVIDASGREIFRSGSLDDKGELDSSAVVFKTVLGDKNGKHAGNLWEAVKVLSDKRIPPKGSANESFKIAVPADATPPFAVTVTLKYRSASQALVDELFGADGGKPEMAIVDMASTTAQLEP